MGGKELAYEQKDISKEEVKKGKARQLFERFKGYAAIGGLSLILAGAAGCGPSYTNCYPVSSPPAPVPIGYNFSMHCSPGGPHKGGKHVKKTPDHKLKYLCKNEKLEKSELAGEAEKLIKKGAGVNNIDEMGKTILLNIIETCPSPEKYDILKTLIKNGANVNQNNPLIRVIKGSYGRSDIKMAKFLLENGADVNAVDSKGDTPLHIAVKNEDADAMKLLLENGAYSDAKNNAGETPLDIVLGRISKWETYKCAKQEKKPTGSKYPWAEKYHYYCLVNEYGLDMSLGEKSAAGTFKNSEIRLEKNLEMAGLLLEKTDINMLDENGETMLLKASRMGDREIAKLLLKKGANAEMTDNSGKTALINAIKNGDAEMAKLLLDSGADVNYDGHLINYDGGNLLLSTVEKILSEEWIYNPEVLKLMLKKGADVNHADYPGNTALSLVYSYNTEDVMGYVFIKGASPKERAEIAKLLIENGADPDTRIGLGADITLLMEVAWSGYAEMAKPLIDGGVDVNAQAGGLGTPLMIAASRSNMEMVKLLLASGAKVDAKDALFGETALMKAVVFGYNTEIVEFLLSKGADPTLKNEDGLTASKIAAKHKNKKLAELLKKAEKAYKKTKKVYLPQPDIP